MGSVRRRSNKDYYAIISSDRLDKPMIFNSWGDAHPRVTGCHAVYKSFFTIEEARKYMLEQQVPEPKEVIKDTALNTTPKWNSNRYYAIAYGASPGIQGAWYGREGAAEKVRKVSGGCHKHFRTLKQANAFIEDWKAAYIEVWSRELKKALDQGLRPHDMEMSLEGIFAY